MKTQLLAWLFFIICSIALSFHACEKTLPPKTSGNELSLHEQLVENESKMIVKTDRDSDHPQINKDVKRILHSKKTIYGGSDINKHPAKNHGGANPLLVNPFRFLFVGMLVFISFFFIV
ncbi:TBC domain-containing protein [Actinidia chinensis var. chinensis]|uniref:TBC domain-containing protein n=1 Tax=Actinidia chinensis var. chinensis TaxID=1590841 RepID=A0A2R6R4X6_ACTCC|nr:TBC domain-containing protein [Actinidia chinensis var. chinensis]